MIPLSNVLDNYFREKISVILFVTFLCALATALILGYLKNKSDLKSTLQVSSSIYSSLLYSKDWDLLNKFSSVLINDNNLQSIKIESKENNGLLYSYSNNQNGLIPVHCRSNSQSELIKLSICRNIVGLDYLSYLIGLVLLFAAVAYLFFLNSKKNAVLFFDEISGKISDILSKEIPPGSTFHIKELNDLYSNITEKSKRIEKLARTAAIVDISRKVAHDLRSPVSVIGMSARKEELTKDELILIGKAAQRIKEISSSLLEQTRFSHTLPNKSRIPLKDTLYEIINEKLIEYEDINLKIEIDSTIDGELFVWINGQDLLRALSNLINNSIESLSGITEQRIKIFYGYIEDYFIVSISDDGPGFSKAFLDKYYNNEVISTKREGNALGIASVIKLLKDVGGELELKNGIKGAVVEMKFRARSIIPKDHPIVQIEDDKYVRAAWSKIAKEKNIKLISVESYADLLRQDFDIPKDAEFFIDYNLGNNEKGDEVASKLSLRGFTNINLATGQDLLAPLNIENINRIIGKFFPY